MKIVSGILALTAAASIFRALWHYYLAKKQAAELPLQEGQGGVFQRHNEHRLRQHATSATRWALALTALTVLAFLLR
jgi:hypothetical protein